MMMTDWYIGKLLINHEPQMKWRQTLKSGQLHY